MDTSKEYIEMCGKAWMIKKKMVDVGDYFNDGEICAEVLEAENNEGYLIKSIYGKYFLPSECVWLSRQDQLQEIMREQNVHNLVDSFSSWHTPFGVLGNAYLDLFNSMEQIWLAYVMDRKFNKIWDGKEWIKKD